MSSQPVIHERWFIVEVLIVAILGGAVVICAGMLAPVVWTVLSNACASVRANRFRATMPDVRASTPRPPARCRVERD